MMAKLVEPGKGLHWDIVVEQVQQIVLKRVKQKLGAMQLKLNKMHKIADI